MSECGIPDFQKITEQYKPAITNNVYKVAVSIPALKTGQSVFNAPKISPEYLFQDTMTALSGMPKENVDSSCIFVKERLKPYAKKEIKTSAVNVAENVAIKSASKKTGITFAQACKKFKFSGKMKVFGLVAAAGLTAYSCIVD